MANSVIKANIGAVLNSYEGDIVTIKSPIERPFIMNMQADINPIQDLHGYDKPWAGGNGKNLIPKAQASDMTLYGLTVTVADDGELTINGTSTGTNMIRVTFPQAIVAGSYTMFMFNPVATNDVQVSLRRGDLNLVTNTWFSLLNTNAYKQFTTTESAYVWQIQIDSGKTLNNFKLKPMMVSGLETSETFEPYSNICPISGWDEVNIPRTGKNLFDGELESGSISGATGQNFADSNYLRSKNYIRIIPTETYKVTLAGVAENTRPVFLLYYDESHNYIGTSAQVTRNNINFVPNVKNASYCRFCFLKDDVTTVCLHFADTSGDYEPYNGNTFTIDLGGTRYGGTIDVTSGVMSVTMELLDLGSVAWTKVIETGHVYFYTTDAFTNIKVPSANWQVADIICSNYVKDSSNNIYSHVKSGTIGVSMSGRIGVYDEATLSLSASDFQTYVDGIQLVYELATPLTVQLTPTQIEALVGENNIWCSTGQTKLTALEMESIS